MAIISGAPWGEYLDGTDNNDVISGYGGDDDIDGFGGHDALYGDEGSDSLSGDYGNDNLYGGSHDDFLVGGGDNDLLDGGTGADRMEGGSGNDIYCIDNSGDLVVAEDEELYGGGFDLVRASISYTLTAGVENLTLLQGAGAINGTGNSLDNVILGNSSSNTLSGLGGSDTLDGGGGADTMLGGTGDDFYYVQNSGDVVTENANEGIDTVYSWINYTLGANVDDLVLQAGAGAIDGSGNALDNTIVGNESDNEIRGFGGEDLLKGAGGSDTIDGGFGNDTLIGGDNVNTVDTVSFQSWDPTGFYAPGSESVRIELGQGGGQGTATRTSIGVVETDTLSGFENIRASNRAETILGNSGANTIEGRGGNDVVDGGRGNDTLNGGDATDTVSFESLDAIAQSGIEIVAIELDGSATRNSINIYNGTVSVVETDTLSGFENVRGSNRMDVIAGNGANNVLEGRGNDDVLRGNGGSDVLDGGQGSDVASYEGNAWRVIAYLGPNGTPGLGYEFGLVSGQEVLLSVDTSISIENMRGSSFNDTLIGNEASNVLDGRGGADTLTGGGGNDTYLVDHAGDTIVENGGQGIDTVRTSVSYTLTAGADVETLETTNNSGTAAINLTGNSSGNVVRGNNGANVINGGNGNDTLTGLGGQDQFLFNTALSAATNVDELSDFNVADDTIRLDDAVFSALTPGGLTAGQFTIGAAAQDGDDVIVYNSATGALFYDSDGVGGTAAIQFAEVTPGLALTHLDFLVV